MLYLLLIIIAIGVLLLSPEGKKLLNFFAVIVTKTGRLLLYVAAVVLLGLVLNSVFNISDDKGGTLVPLLLAFLIIRWSGFLYQLHKQGKLKPQFIKNRVAQEWHNNKPKCVVVIILLLVIVITWVVIPILA